VLHFPGHMGRSQGVASAPFSGGLQGAGPLKIFFWQFFAHVFSDFQHTIFVDGFLNPVKELGL
jgi:hypothetical protein